MKLGVFTVLFSDKSFVEMLDFVHAKGLRAVEIGTGGNPGAAHCALDELLGSESRRRDYLDELRSRDLVISAFSCHDNPISPNESEARIADEIFRKTVRLAELMGVPVVNTFSGVPGSHEGARYPNWPVTPWPTVYSDILEWQWEEKLIPYWRDAGKFAEDHGVKVGIELHAGFLVHTPHTMLKLREATCEAVGANFDPSHLWWQGIDPVAAIKILGRENAIHHFHAKDTYIDWDHVNMYGLTDMQPYGDLQTRAWSFRSVGYGHDLKVWSDMISALRTYGYDYVISIEHEDALMSVEEGFSRAVSNLKSVIIEEQSPEIWWA